MNGLLFVKYSGAGNDFVVIAGDAAGLPDSERRELARRLCARRTGIGADGLLVVGPPDPTGEVPVDYFNADGSLAAFCGNGARCAADFVFRRWRPEQGPSRLRFASLEIEAREHELGVEIALAAPSALEGRHALAAGEGKAAIDLTLVDAGVRHAVAFVDTLAHVDLKALDERMRRTVWGRELNLTLAEPRRDGSLAVRTAERGCGETLACGSGALAAAALEFERRGGNRCLVLPPGGSELHVRRDEDRFYLAGEARALFSGEWRPG